MPRAVVLFLVLLSISGFALAQDVPRNLSLSNRLIGAWRLISVETRRANGEIIYPYYGQHPEGILILRP